MKLTSKRLLVLALATAFCGYVATAAETWVKDTFEEAALESKIGDYKKSSLGVGNTKDRVSWLQEEGDASKIVAGEGSYLGAPTITDDGHANTKVLKLETEGKILERRLAFEYDSGTEVTNKPAAVAIPTGEGNALWVDTLIKFTPSEDEPESFDGARIALWVNADSNLVVRHYNLVYELEGIGDFVQANSEGATTSTYTATELDPDKWYRLTVEIVSLFDEVAQEGTIDFFKVYINGQLLEMAGGFVLGEVSESELTAVPLPAETGYGFFMASDTAEIKNVSFQGTGFIDDLVVADEHAPFDGGTQGTLLTLIFDDTKILNVKVNDEPVSSMGDILSGSELTFDIADWYVLDAVDGEGITFADGVIEADEPGRTATISAKLLDDNAASSLAGYNVDASKLAAWAVANSLGESAFRDGDYLNQYLFNVGAGDDVPELSITSIAVDGTDVTITVATDNENVDFDEINGTLIVETTETLGGEWDEPLEVQIKSTDFDGNLATFVLKDTAGKFIKAKVK